MSTSRIFWRDFMAESNRFRDEKITVRTTNFELDMIMQNYKESGIKSFQEFAIKILSDGYIVKIDTTQLHNYAYEINKIGVNLNQIAHKINQINSEAPDIYLLKQDIDECLLLMKEVNKIVRRHWMS